MAAIEITPIVPTLAGTTFAVTAAVDGSDEYDYIPISSSLRTLVVIHNTEASGTTMTFTSQADEWGNTGASLDKTITIGASKTYITGTWLRDRWADPADDANTCTVTYSDAAHTSIAVINVPNASKD